MNSKPPYLTWTLLYNLYRLNTENNICTLHSRVKRKLFLDLEMLDTRAVVRDGRRALSGCSSV